MAAQGDQAAPKAPKLKPNDAQSLPKVAQRPPKTPKREQNDHKMWPEVLQKCKKSNKKKQLGSGTILESIFELKIFKFEQIW